jgi:hypothetical protein
MQQFTGEWGMLCYNPTKASHHRILDYIAPFRIIIQGLGLVSISLLLTRMRTFVSLASCL